MNFNVFILDGAAKRKFGSVDNRQSPTSSDVPRLSVNGDTAKNPRTGGSLTGQNAKNSKRGSLIPNKPENKGNFLTPQPPRKSLIDDSSPRSVTPKPKKPLRVVNGPPV